MSMKKEMTVTGKTIEEALAAAAKELGADDAAKIRYEVLEEPKKGILGIGAVPAKIHATYIVGGDKIAFDFIRKMVADMELNVEVAMSAGREADEVLITVDGPDAGALIGHHGETLDSLQYLANLAANKKVDGEKREYKKIMIDVEGYRAKREETLRALARRMAAKVLRYKKSIMLEPMPPAERRVIHSEIQNIQGVSTNSIGSENNRKIVIYLEDGAVGEEIPVEPEETAQKSRNRRRRSGRGNKPQAEQAPKAEEKPIEDDYDEDEDYEEDENTVTRDIFADDLAELAKISAPTSDEEYDPEA